MKKSKRKPHRPGHFLFYFNNDLLTTFLPKAINHTQFWLFVNLIRHSKNGTVEYNSKIFAQSLGYKRLQSFTDDISKLVAIKAIATKIDKVRNSTHLAINPKYCLAGTTSKAHDYQRIAYEEYSEIELETSDEHATFRTQHEEKETTRMKREKLVAHTATQQIFLDYSDKFDQMAKEMRAMVKCCKILIEKQNEANDTPEVREAKKNMEKVIRRANNVIPLFS